MNTIDTLGFPSSLRRGIGCPATPASCPLQSLLVPAMKAYAAIRPSSRLAHP